MIWSLRVTPEEAATLRAAAEALDTNVSSLVTTGAISSAHRLGFFHDAGENTAFRFRGGPWKDKPQRRDESASERINVAHGPMDHELVARVVTKLSEADAALTLPLFIIGSALRFIANKRLNQPKNTKLQSIHVPEQYLVE